MSSHSSIYRVWKDSIPVLPFPFVHFDKHEGRITHTWADVKEGLNRDAINHALAFATGHFTPTSPQSAIMRETMEKEQKRHLKALREESATHSRPESQLTSVTVSTTAPTTTGAQTTEGGVTGTAPSVPRTTGTTTGTSRLGMSRVRGELMSAQEKDILYGGGGRKEYLKMRRSKSVQERYGMRAPTTSHMYGWDCNPSSLKRIRAHHDDGDEKKRKKGLGTWMRSRGVFSAEEFVKPVHPID